MDIVDWIYLLLPLFYLILLVTGQSNKNIPTFNLKGGALVLLIFTIAFLFTEGTDKEGYREAFLTADTSYLDDSPFSKDKFWAKFQLLLSSSFLINETIYFLFYAFVYCLAYFVISRKYFPYKYSGIFVLCVVSCLGFVSYGTNGIRAGFALSLLLFAFSRDNLLVKMVLVVMSVGCHITMLLPLCGFLTARYLIKSYKYCELFWIVCFLISASTSVASDILMLFGSLDERMEGYAEGDSVVYNVGFRIDFIIYSLVPILFARYNTRNMNLEIPIYTLIYRSYLIINAIWLLIIRIPSTDRVAYLSWFMIPFILLYPILNGYLSLNRPIKYIVLSVGMFMGVNIFLALR